MIREEEKEKLRFLELGNEEQDRQEELRLQRESLAQAEQERKEHFQIEETQGAIKELNCEKWP